MSIGRIQEPLSTCVLPSHDAELAEKPGAFSEPADSLLTIRATGAVVGSSVSFASSGKLSTMVANRLQRPELIARGRAVRLCPTHRRPLQGLLQLWPCRQGFPGLGKGEPLPFTLVALGPVVVLAGDDTLEEVVS